MTLAVGLFAGCNCPDYSDRCSRLRLQHRKLVLANRLVGIHHVNVRELRRFLITNPRRL